MRLLLLCLRRGALHPRAPGCSLEGVDGDGPLTHLVAQPSHFDDLDHLPAEHPRPVLVEQLRIDARRLELAQDAAARALRWV